MTAPALLALLADGQMHSGETLARRLKVSRAAVWKGIERLRTQGIDVQALPRRGYRLAAAVELLNPRLLRKHLAPGRAALVRDLTVHFAIDSTNTKLLEAAAPRPGVAGVCLAEIQTAGRGRRGRRWVAPFGSGIALSLSWSFEDAPRDLPALSLAVGVATLRALRRAGARDIGLKWPNDIWRRDAKLGGVLIELRAEASGPAFVVIGIGLNIILSAGDRRQIESNAGPIAALAEACADTPSRNMIAGAVLDETLGVLARFATHGFEPFRDEWLAADVLQGRGVSVLRGERRIAGRARGIDTDGGFLVEVDGTLTKFVSGEVSLRLDPVQP